VAGGDSGARIVAVEIDPVLAAELPKTIADCAPGFADRVDVVTADALRIGAGDVPAGPTVLAANLPYNVAVPVVLRLLATFPTIARGVVMVQAEVADRMCAGPGSRVYGAPSAKLAWYATARAAGTVPRSVFWPVPNVDSKLVAFARHEAEEVPETEEAAGVTGTAGAEAAMVAEAAGDARVTGPIGVFEGSEAAEESGAAETAGLTANREETFRVVDAAFGQRRKTLRAALAGWAGSPARAEAVARVAGVDPGARGESLSIAQFARIAAAAKAPEADTMC
jgi:16S rRNA (adenine1518-N6/adenine1519-N6)-dimethyltransferase